MEASRLNAVFTRLGFDPDNPTDRARLAPALAFALPLAALPCLLLAPLDTDRALPLAFLPAILLGLRNIRSAPKTDLLLLTWIIVSLTLSAFVSDHTARALVMASSVLLALLTGAAAAPLSHSRPAVRLILIGIVFGAVAGTLMVRLGVAADRMYFPVYWSARLMGAHQFAGCAASLALLWLTPAGFRQRALPAAAALIVWIGLAWSGSRAPALGLAVFIVFWFWRGSPDERRFLLRWVPALSLLALACSYPLGSPFPQLGWWQAFERTAGAVQSGAVNIAAMTSSRTDYWAASWQQILRTPWLGNGADAYLFLSPTQHGNQPHSMPIQWLLEYGVIGLLAWLALLARSLRSLWQSSRAPLAVFSAALMAGAAAYSLFDGVFYHMIVFVPVAVFAGLAFGSAAPPASTPFSCVALRIPALTAATLLLVHNWLGFMLLNAPNVTPDSHLARLLRAFPSTTHAIQNWTERWRRTDPALAMEWIHWAQTVSTNPGALHVHAAQVYLWQKNFAAAETEMLRCLEKVNPTERVDAQQAIDNIRQWQAAHAASNPPTP